MKLTVITINWNNAIGLRKTIESVVNQTWKDFEYIVIDGASTDESVDIIKLYSDKITYWISEKDKGIYNAMNKGLEQANGEYVYYLNSGDVFADDSVIKRVFSRSRSGDVLYGNYYSVTEDHSSLYIYPSKLSNAWFYSGTLCHQAIFVKTELQKNNLFDETYRFVADWKVVFKLFVLEKRKFEYLDFPISYYTLDGFSSKPENIEDLNKERLKVLKQSFLLTDTQTEIEMAVKLLKLTNSPLTVYNSTKKRTILLSGIKAQILFFIAKILNKL